MAFKKILFLSSESETEQAGADFYPLLQAGSVVYLQGPLGAGKTSFVRGILRAAGWTQGVKSPTYTLVEEYFLPTAQASALREDGRVFFYHVDLYRIDDPQELENMGWREYCRSDAVLLIEWPEKAAGLLPAPHWSCLLKTDPQNHGRFLDILSSHESH